MPVTESQRLNCYVFHAKSELNLAEFAGKEYNTFIRPYTHIRKLHSTHIKYILSSRSMFLLENIAIANKSYSHKNKIIQDDGKVKQ